MPDRWWNGAGDRPAGEAETYARLEAAVRDRDMRACDGCTRCAMRCVDGIDLSYPEFARLVRAAMAMPAPEQARVLGQDKVLHWGEGAVVALCPFLDRDTDRCAIYPVRPLICRLFGYAPWLPCPTGKQNDSIEGAVEIMVEYASLERHPLRAWLRRYGLQLPGLSDDIE
ncbi:MAG TPA: YkgJ family cysteine cluster protein [Armatimonadota bacterium]|nr:YkgJ family cysteine cluster protein [Armatimonadota bacterium]HOM83536.1 YkgJ family cysteine cluster protein [Armatimonadota bacterium]HPO71529.1 YkgJ family cysteine cluster protein [Armatimonadota bacterium]HPT97571.1 YkgJ family cysteine cluster protein [Armatimonadota bacterium]